MIKKILFFIICLYSNVIYSQKSDLGRFTVNINKGCSPLKVEIIDENVDSSVSVIQYDFNKFIYNLRISEIIIDLISTESTP